MGVLGIVGSHYVMTVVVIDLLTVVVIDLLVCVAVLCGCVRYCGITLCDDSGSN